MKQKQDQEVINMKYKKLILGLALFIISMVYIIHPFIINKETDVNSFKDQIIRFH